MAEIPVERKSAVPWWAWLLGLLALLLLFWFVYELFDDDRDDRVITNANTTYNANTAATPAGVVTTTPAVTPTVAETGTGNRITDAGLYATTADKLSLAGREAQLTNVRVVRVVGPRTFTIASGSDELYVMLDDNSARQVGTQGKIDVGDTLNVTGRFERLRSEEIGDLGNARFRSLTEQERAFLRNTQIYLNASQVGNLD